MKKILILMLVAAIVTGVWSCQEDIPEIKSTYKIEFHGWEDSAAYFINYTKDAKTFGYDTFYQNFVHEFESLPSELDSLYFDVTDTMKRFLEVIFWQDGEEIYRKSEQANVGFLKASWYPEK
jgi:hypothetical protein